MSCRATKSRRFIIATVVAPVLIAWGGGLDLAWSAEAEPSELPFEGPVHLDDSSLPDPTRTPGDAFERAKRKDLCDDEADNRQRPPAPALCDSAFTDYHIPPERRFQYKCSFLVPLGVGGSATQINVWPQPVAEAAFKEKLDIELHNQVCSEDIAPIQAQREIVGDWVKTYRRYILLNDPPPLVIESRATEEPGSAPAAIPPASVQGAPTDFTSDGAPPERRRRDRRVGSGEDNDQPPQGMNTGPPQSPTAGISQRPVAISPRRQAAMAPLRRAPTLSPRRNPSDLRPIGR